MLGTQDVLNSFEILKCYTGNPCDDSFNGNLHMKIKSPIYRQSINILFDVIHYNR